MDCNPQSNVIIPRSFYVANMKDLSEDKDNLKENLWPALQGLYVHQDIGSFWTTSNLSKMQARMYELKQFLRNMAVHRPCTSMANSIVQVLGGEGICELEVHIAHCPPSFKLVGD